MTAPSDAYEDIAPRLPSRCAVYAKARELRELAQRAEEFAGTGPTADLAACVRQFDQMRAILGEGNDD